MVPIFERFTDRARRSVVLSQEEARRLNHNYIGTEHILLGLIGEGEGIAAKALESLDISLDEVRRRVEKIGNPSSSSPGHIPYTPRAKKVLEFSLREALQLGHNYIGTEHVLLGLIREGDGVAMKVLGTFTSGSVIRGRVMDLLSGYTSDAPRRSLPTWTRPFQMLQTEAWEVAESKGFHDVDADFATRICLIHSEASEALEAYRDGHDVDDMWLRESDDKPEGVPSELADIVIRVLDLAEHHGIDLAEAIKVKMDFNRKRPHLHGGKAF